MGNKRLNLKLLTINPGSTSTKVALFHNLTCLSTKTLQHDDQFLTRASRVIDQLDIRMQAVETYIAEQKIDLLSLAAVVGRGGYLKPLKSGTYRVNTQMLEDLSAGRFGEHASNLGALIAHDLATQAMIPAFIVDPIVVDELSDLARFSGHPELPRNSVFHALNQKAVARKAAAALSKDYRACNLIVAHLGGGITVAAHERGCVVDVNNGLEEGPFTPERSGNLPVLKLVDLCFSGRFSHDEIRKMLVGRGGLRAYTGTSDCRQIEAEALAGDGHALKVLQAMSYQISREIGACAASLSGQVDAIVITGGLAFSKHLVEWVSDRIRFIAPIFVYPGENEMQALAEGAYRVLCGEEEAMSYI